MRPNAQGRGVPRELWTGADQLTALGVVTGAPVVGNPVLENLAPSWNLPATINVPQSDSVDVRQYLTNGTGLTISVTNLPTGVTYNSGTESLEGAASGTSSGTATFTAGSAVDTATVALVEAGNPLFFDDFEYETPVESLISGANNPFVSQGGWAGLVSNHTENPGKRTDIWTVDYATFQANTGFNALPGFPSGGTRCVRYDFENVDGGTDGYLRLAPAGGIPANFWVQFWYFMPHQSGYEQSRVQNRFKWIYPGSGTGWPRILLSGSGTETVYTHMTDVPGASGGGSDGRLVFIDRDSSLGNDSVNSGMGPEYTDPYYGFPTENAWKLGPNMDADLTTAVLYPNTWYLVKIHYDVSVMGEGTFEMWMREHGQPFRKTHQWISGQNAPTLAGKQFSGGAFEWPTTYTGNFDGFKIGSTIGWTTDGSHMYIYMDDFALAATSADLPTYGDEP